MKKSNLQKYAVAFVALIFLGSIAGAMLYSTGNELEAPELPKELILTQLSDSQRQLILSKGYVIIDAEIPVSCFLECAAAKMALEQSVLAFNPAAYLVEATSQSDALDIPVSMDSYRGKKALASFNQTEVEDFVCESTPFRIDECVLRKMYFQDPKSSIAQNETANSTASGNTSDTASQTVLKAGGRGGGINGTSANNTA